MKFTFVKVVNDKKVGLIADLVDKLDDLYEELSYNNSAEEVVCINKKIKLREDMLLHLVIKSLDKG